MKLGCAGAVGEANVPHEQRMGPRHNGCCTRRLTEGHPRTLQEDTNIQTVAAVAAPHTAAKNVHMKRSCHCVPASQADLQRVAPAAQPTSNPHAVHSPRKLEIVLAA